MIHTQSKAENYLTELTNSEFVTQADATKDKGGKGQGFRPHELLEAALASCMNLSLRMCADEKSIPLRGAAVNVSLDRSNPDTPTFKYSVTLDGELSSIQREILLEAAKACPVRMTLSKALAFEQAPDS